MDLSDGCLKILVGAFIAIIILVFFILPISLFLESPATMWWIVGLPVIILFLIVGTIFELNNNKVFNLAFIFITGIMTIVFIRDIFSEDIREGLAFVLVFPVSVIIFYIFKQKMEATDELSQQLVIKALAFLVGVIVYGLIFLTFEYFLPG